MTFNFSLRLLLSAVISSLGFQAAVARPQKLHPLHRRDNFNETLGKTRTRIGCSAEQKAIEVRAWEDSWNLAAAVASWAPGEGRRHQDAFDLYFGTHSADYLGAGGQIQTNLAGAYNVHEPTSWPWTQHLYILCNDNFGQCTLDTYAYAWTDSGRIWDNQYIVFCPAFHYQEDLKTIVDKADDGTYDKTQANTFIKAQGAMVLHELMHLNKLVTSKQVEDNPQCKAPGSGSGPEGEGIYNAGPVAAGAKQYNAEGMVCVADAYRVTAASVFAQNRFKLPTPPGPPDGPGNGVGDPKETSKRLGSPPYDTENRPKGLPNPDDPYNTPGDDSMDFDSGDGGPAGGLFGVGQVVEPGKDVEGEDALKVIPTGSPIS